MLEFKSIFGNRGGVSDIYAVTPETVRSLTKDYRNGLWQVNIWLHPKEHDGIVVHIPVRTESKNWEETDIRDENGLYYSVSITGKIPACKGVDAEILKILASNRWLVITRDNNGEWRLSGTKSSPLTCTCVKTTSSMISGLNSALFEFSGESLCESRYLEFFDPEIL